MKLIKNEEFLYSENRIQMEVSDIRYGFLDSEWCFDNLRASFTRIYIPIKGSASITYHETTTSLLPGNIYVIPAGLSFSCSCPEELEKIYIHLTLTHPNGSDVFWGMDTCLILPDTHQWAERACTLYQTNDLASLLQFKMLLYELLSHALTVAQPRPPHLRTYTPLTKDALAYIDTHLCASLTIHEIANALFVSQNLLQKQFREDLNKPIGQYVDDRLMARAEQYLLRETESIKEISDRLGFCDQFYFSRKFTQTHGISPLRFRQSHGGSASQSKEPQT